MSDSNNSKTVQVLREEYYFLDVYISKLERENQDLVKRHIEFENSLTELIDDLWETRIDPLRFELEDTNKKLDLLKIENSNLSTRIKQLNEVIKNQITIINYAVGYISACEQFRDKHPNDVKNWLFEGLK